MNAPGRFYVYVSIINDSYSMVYEVDPDTYVMDNSQFSIVERPVYPQEQHGFMKSSTNVARVYGWYDTIAEAIFAFEVLR